ncbi:MAG: hypothetical protein ACFFDT_38490 [Candidatus Hodarchaeota archaeon]
MDEAKTPQKTQKRSFTEKADKILKKRKRKMIEWGLLGEDASLILLCT